MFRFLKKLFSKRLLLVTHNGQYHTDDVFACAVIEMVLEKRGVRSKLVRTREKTLIEKGDIVWDVGDIYDPSIMRFDHHQPEGAGERGNGIPYASFGLVWREYGLELCNDQAVHNFIDKKIAQPVDAIDNGVSISEKKFDGVVDYYFYDFLNIFMPSFKETFSKDKAFRLAVSAAKLVLDREIKKQKEREELKQFIEQDYQKAPDKRLIVLTTFYPWKETISAHPEPLFVVSEDIENKRWVMITVRDDWSSFVNRKDMPLSWAGLRDEELEKVSGVEGAIFCHKGLWLAGAKTKEGIMKMAEIALNS